MPEQPAISDLRNSDSLPTSNKVAKEKELDAREARFADEYLIDLDVERAAITPGAAQ